MIELALACLIAWSEDERANIAPECTQQVWELLYEGQVISFGADLTEEECKALAKELDAQTRPFTRIECKWKWVCREEL